MCPHSRQGASGQIIVAAIDDHPLILRGLQAFLSEDSPEIELPVVVATVDELLAAGDERVSVVLLDLHLGDGTKPENNVRRIREWGAQVVLFTSEHRPAVVRRSLEAGALALVLKEDPNASVVAAIMEAHRGRFYASSRLAHQVVSDPAGLVRFSERECDVLRLRAKGLQWSALARCLGMSAETARTFAYRALEKYSGSGGPPVDSLGELAFRAIVDGHVESDKPDTHR